MDRPASSRGTWSVAVTARAPSYQVDQFLEHYVGLGADRIYLFFDDRDYASFDTQKYASNVVHFVCDERYWSTVYKATPLSDKKGRPDAVEIRQGVNALFAREIMTSEWLLHVDIDEFIYVKKDVESVLSDLPDNVFSVLLRTYEAVYDSVKESGKETDTVYFRKSVHQRDLLRQLYSDDLLKCASNGLWGTFIGKSFIRRGHEIKSMSVHWPSPVDASLVTNVPTYYIDLLHFEGQTFDLFKEKFMIRVFKNVAKHMPHTYKVRLDITKKAYDERGEDGLLEVYKDFYVMDPEKLSKAMDLGVVVKIDWTLGGVSSDRVLSNNPIFDLGARISNWGGEIVKSYHNTYLAFDDKDGQIKAVPASELFGRENLHPVEIESYDCSAKLFVKINHDMLCVVPDGSALIVKPASSDSMEFSLSRDGHYITLSHQGRFISVSPSKEISADREVASQWEQLRIKTIYPQLA